MKKHEEAITFDELMEATKIDLLQGHRAELRRKLKESPFIEMNEDKRTVRYIVKHEIPSVSALVDLVKESDYPNLFDLHPSLGSSTNFISDLVEEACSPKNRKDKKIYRWYKKKATKGKTEIKKYTFEGTWLLTERKESVRTLSVPKGAPEGRQRRCIQVFPH